VCLNKNPRYGERNMLPDVECLPAPDIYIFIAKGMPKTKRTVYMEQNGLYTKIQIPIGRIKIVIVFLCQINLILLSSILSHSAYLNLCEKLSPTGNIHTPSSSSDHNSSIKTMQSMSRKVTKDILAPGDS
jgi:hypothetical protein